MASRAALSLLKALPVVLPARGIATTACVWGKKSRWQAPLRRELYNRQKRMEKAGLAIKSKRSDYLEWNYEAELYAFCKRLNEEISDDLLREALTDQSYIQQERQRQEALGVEAPGLDMKPNGALAARGSDLIHNYAMSFLRSSLPLFPEEGVRSVVEYLTSADMMAQVGSGIGLKDLVLCQEYPPSTETLGQSFQAIVGAISLSSSLEQAQTFIKDFVLTQLVGKDLNDIWKIEEPMELLRDILSRSGLAEPEPRLIFESGKNTIQAVYQVGIYCNKEFMGTGYGETVDTAVDQASRDCLRRFFHTTDSMAPLPLGKQGKDMSLNEGSNASVEDWTLDNAKNVVNC